MIVDLTFFLLVHGIMKPSPFTTLSTVYNNYELIELEVLISLFTFYDIYVALICLESRLENRG